MSKEKETVEETVTEQAPAEAAAGLTIQDLSTALQIITVVQARGAIKAEEMSVVGALYNKLQAFLKSVGVTPEGVSPEGESAENSEKKV